MSNDIAATNDQLIARLGAPHGMLDGLKFKGTFRGVFRDARGKVLRRVKFDNLLTTLAKNLLLDTTLAGAAYTVVGPFMGLISSTSYSTIVAADTMASHAGWLEAGSTNTPTYSGTRLTCAWSAASAGVKALSAGLVFTFTGTGTVQGAFIVTGTGAVATLMSTVGTLFAAGTLATPQPVIATNTLTLSYSATLT